MKLKKNSIFDRMMLDRRLIRIYILLLVALPVLLNSGCNTSGCTENRSAVPFAEFYAASTEQLITLDSIVVTGIGAPADTVLSAAGQRISQLYLPMRPTHSSVGWCFSYKWLYLDDVRLNDTITFEYESEPYFASEECGAYYRYKITGVDYTEHLIDSVAVLDSIITNVDKTYINIYFRVSQE